jgi:arylsulfatase A-like enzyme
VKVRRTRLKDSKQPNILIIVFDAFTATHMSLYGYDRETTPYINSLAEKAIVYHQHYAGGHWTYPGTMSLLTGVLPWSHRGFTRGPYIAQPFGNQNLFAYFDDYNTMAYTHNFVADEVLEKLKTGIDQIIPRTTLYIYKSFILNNILSKDYDIATISKRRITNKIEEGYASSLFLSNLTELIGAFRERQLRKNFVSPPKVTGSGDLFLLEDATDWIIEQTKELQGPYLSYIHLFPPHDPYVVRKDFADTFRNDGYKPIRKPKHFFTKIKFTSYEETDELRLAYNQAIRYVDAEFRRLMEGLENAGQLKNTIVILTSDHGEMFERGLTEHIRPVFYQSIIQVPLLIFLPNQTDRIDIFETTSALDIIPTLLHLAGKNTPGILEGDTLPPFANPGPLRSIFAMDARNNSPDEKLSLYTAMIRKGPFKFTQYYGYKQLPNDQPYFELYNLEQDPEELVNLVDKETGVAKEMGAELAEKIFEKDHPLNG